MNRKKKKKYISQKTIVTKLQVDDEMKELFATIDYMVEYSDKIINKSHPSNSRQTLSLATYSALTQYAVGIKIMIKDRPMSKVAETLVRSMFEAWINLEYMIVGKDDQNLLLNVRYSLDSQKNRMQRVEDFFIRNKLTEITGMTLEKVQQMITDKTAELNEIDTMLKHRKVAGRKEVKLHEKARLVDAAKGYDEPGHSVEYNYQMVYGHWSASVHLGYDGLMSWVKLDGKNVIFNGNETLSDSKMVLWTTIALLKDVSVLTLKELKLYDKEYDDKIQEIIERTR